MMCQIEPVEHFEPNASLLNGPSFISLSLRLSLGFPLPHSQNLLGRRLPPTTARRRLCLQGQFAYMLPPLVLCLLLSATALSLALLDTWLEQIIYFACGCLVDEICAVLPSSSKLEKFCISWNNFSISDLIDMGCCGCFGFLRKPQRSLIPLKRSGGPFQDFLLPQDMDDPDGIFYNRDNGNNHSDSDCGSQHFVKRSEEILLWRFHNGLICREVPVKETRRVILSEDDNGDKMINEYVRQCKIGSGSYGKVVLYRSTEDGKQYAIKIFHKSHLLKLHVAPYETAMNDVLREVAIMKMLDHPNIVNLIEVIDDPNTDNFYMVLEYVEGKWIFEGSGAADCLGESTTRRYLRDIVAGLMHLHSHNVIHGDIKPDNLLVTKSNNVKIGDFSVSQVFEDDNDMLRRSPGTPVFTAPECCLDVTYHGKAADTWAVGVTLYCMVFGRYPFLGDTLQDTYDKIVNNPIIIPDGIDPQLQNLIEGLLCKDPKARLTLHSVSEHPWVIGDEGPIPQYSCRCSRLKSST
ncbi:hypothetical protein ZIOFF_030174 [Zingiber officinale]|uniref:non-specific serine/threonine protein kinase n=1 Tax=Zingiber officinale TaxID=94328 RepID=A0A8J5L4P8_ZINOF|nr:hypothetical protein ZIOFF_030174 [Zingiber officinale]